MSVEPARGSPRMKIGSASGAPQSVRREELAAADLDLLAGVVLDDLRPVAALGALQGIAALVATPRFGVLAAIFMGLAEREAQMIAIDDRRLGCGLGGAHGGDLSVQKPVGLEVRETPIGISETRTRSRGRPIRPDGLLAPAHGFQGVRHRQMQVRRPRRFLKQFAVQRDRLVVFAESDAGGGVERSKLRISRFERQEFLELDARRLVLVALDQRQRIIVACGTVIRRQHEHRLEQQFGIVEHAARHADFRQQAHGFDLVSMLEQVGADDVLRRREFAIREQAGGRDDLGRQAPQRCHVLRRHGGIFLLAAHLVQAL